MDVTSRLTRPLKRRKEALTSAINGFLGPIKEATQNLKGLIPNAKGFAGSEDQADEEPKVPSSLSLRLQKFKASLKGLSDFQKLILLTVAVCLPAGIVLSVLIAGLIKKQKSGR